MSKNEKIDYPDGNDDREDIQWFENYEKHKTKHLERLKNEDILNYIKDVEQNCRLEINSGDEDYAGTKKSSKCNVRCSGTRFRSFKKIKSSVTSRKNKNTLKKKPKRSFSRDATDACNYCCSARKFHFRDSPELTARDNFRRDLDTSTKSIRDPNLSRNFYKYREFSPAFYGWYSRKDHKVWPTETASLEVTKDWSQNAIRDSNINKSKTDRKSAKVHTFKLLRRKQLDDSTYIDVYPSASNEKTRENDLHYRVRKQRGETRMRKLNEESDVNNFVNQQPFNKIYSGRDMAFSYQAPLHNGGYKERYTSGYRYPVRRFRQPTSYSLSSRSNRLMALTRLPETSNRASLLQERTSQWENEIGPPKASSSIIEASIDRSYQREMKPKNNTIQRRRRLDALGEQECYRRPYLLRESGKLCKVVHTHEDKQWLDCCCEDAERDETADCSRYCHCPENTRPQLESTCRPVAMSKRVNYTAAILRRTLSKSVQSRDNDEAESEINLSMEEDLQNEGTVGDNHIFNNFDDFDDVRTENYGDTIDLEGLKPRVSFPDDWARHGSYEVARDCKKLSNHLKSSQGEATGARTALRKKITARYPGKEFSFAIRTEKPVSRDSSELRYDTVEAICECREPFHDPPAARPAGSCTCIGNDEKTERNDSDSSRWISDTVYCCCRCSCSSTTSRGEKDPVKKLESFCEKVKAVNQDIFRKPSKSTYRNARANTQEYTHGDSDEQNQSAFSTRRSSRRTRSVEREWLADSARLRLEKPKHSHGGANLEKILIYPPRGEGGPPLTLYKRSSNISCHVKGDADIGFRYSVTYVQKFISPTWMPSLSPEVPSRETDEECDCSADYG